MKDERKVLMKYFYRKERREKYIKLSDVYEMTKGGRYEKRVHTVRGVDMADDIGKAGNSIIAAEKLPRIYPSCGPDHSYTGLVFLSFRTNQGMSALEQLRRLVNVWDHTLMSFVGSSGQSLKVLIPYRLTEGGLPTDETQTALFQQYAYKRAAEYVHISTGMMAEEVAHDGTEHFCFSFDPQAYYNPKAKAVEMDQPTQPLTDVTAAVVKGPEVEVSLDAEVLPGYTKRETDVVKFNFLCRQLAFGKKEEPDVQLMQLATECRASGIDQELATKLTISMGAFFKKDILVRTTFNNAYEKHPLGVANPIENKLVHQQLMEQFLKRRYMFRRNRVTGDLEYQEKWHYALDWKPLTEEAINDINTAAINEGIKVWPKDLERIIVSERTDEYDPVRDWLNALPQWDGRDRLGELADRVKTEAKGWRENFKVWMRSMVSQWRNGKDALYGAQMVLMLVGGQGSHKSTFMRMLLPKQLMPFYIDRIDFSNKKEALRALSRFLLINIDEYDQVSKAQTAFLKHLIQRTDVKERKLYSTTFEQQQRYAAFCATTNSLVPLKDDSGSRRYLVVEVNGLIDTDTQGNRQIDYPQLYAQIVYEIEHGKEYAFTGKREQQIIEANANYYETPNVVALFEDMFRAPQSGDEVLMLSPTELLERIRDKKKVNVVNQSNNTILGLYLRRKGYKKGKGRQERRYAVALQE